MSGLWRSALPLLWLLGLLTPPLSGHSAEPASNPADPEVLDLGGGRYRIGSIDIDRNLGRFEVVGTVLFLDTAVMPIEFLAVSKGGMKAYEAIIELDTGAIEFNTACLLIGLDPANATLPRYHFDPEPVLGDRVELLVRWDDDGGLRQHPLHELIRSDGERVVGDWVYTGSAFGPGGVYMAESFGTLIGVVHDPDSIIQHRSGLGLGNYGAVTMNPEVMPPPGTRVVITVAAVGG